MRTETRAELAANDRRMGAVATVAVARKAIRQVLVGSMVLAIAGWLPLPGRALAATFFGLGDLPGGNFYYSGASGVSADGAVVVGQSHGASGYEAFRWTQGGGMVGLGDLPGGNFYSWAYGASADGAVVVVGASYGTSGQEAFVWDAANKMRSLHEVLVNEHGLGVSLAGWVLRTATGISADGRTLVGQGINPYGQSEAWLARFDPPAAVVPVPAALPLMLTALASLLLVGRRRKVLAG